MSISQVNNSDVKRKREDVEFLMGLHIVLKKLDLYKKWWNPVGILNLKQYTPDPENYYIYESDEDALEKFKP